MTRDAKRDTPRGGPAEDIGATIARFLRDHGHAARVAQAVVLDDWLRVAGPEISRITEARTITGDGTLVVGVTTNAWMSELAMHEGEFLARLNEGFSPPRVRRIRWQIKVESARP